MEYLRLTNIIETNQQNLRETITSALSSLESAQKYYPCLLLEVIANGHLTRQIDLAQTESAIDTRANPDSPLSNSAGCYFLNEDVIGGSRERDVLLYTNRLGSQSIPGWKAQAQKLKLGPGVGFIEAPPLYRRLIDLGLKDPRQTINYTAPFGTSEARQGIKAIMDSRIDPEGDFFPDDGVFITEGATEGVDLFMEAIASLYPKSRVVFLGLSYYTGPFSAMQKGLTVDRLITNPVNMDGSTKFFPTASEISGSTPSDTKAFVLTIPNNPNGETYPDQELRQILQYAKERNIFILFDGIFENMYFDQERNYRSDTLQIATELGCLDKIVAVDSLAKTRNMPGERIGFMAATNPEIITSLTNIVMARRCNPRLILGPLLLFEGLARKTKALMRERPNASVDGIVDKIFGANGYPFTKDKFVRMYDEWNRWDEEALKYYRDNLTIVRALLDGTITSASPDQAAFNTFVQMIKPETNLNCVDYLAKLMFTLATYTQVGPCFGISQKLWDKELGLWPRITYACSKNDLIEGLIRLITFTRFYAEKNFGDPNKFPVLNITYDNQV